jgi:hypothetical protein
MEVRFLHEKHFKNPNKCGIMKTFSIVSVIILKGDTKMTVALETRNSYENFVLEKDIMYFRVGEHGLVSFHGKNFHIKKRMSTEQIIEITTGGAFFKVNTDCYVNTHKIVQIQDGKVFFEVKGADSKYTSVTKLRQYRLKEIVQQHKAEAAKK